MLVNINLLPKKEKQKKTYIFLIILSSILLIAGIIFSTLFLKNMDNELAQLEQNIKIATQLNSAYKENLEKMQSNSDYEQLLQAIQWVEEQGVSHVYIMEQLVQPLPSRGFWQNYSDDGVSTVSIRVQFDTQKEAAYYLEKLLEIPWVNDAIMTDIRQTERSYENVSINRVLTSITIVYNQEEIKKVLDQKDGDQ